MGDGGYSGLAAIRIASRQILVYWVFSENLSFRLYFPLQGEDEARLLPVA